MKKTLKKICNLWIAVLCVLAFSLSLVACGEEETVYYTVTFDSNGGSEVASQQVEEGGTATEPEDPELDGYVFGGWYSDSSLETSYDFSTAVTSDITLYAGWTQETVTVTFDLNYDGAESFTVEVVVGESAERPDDPERDGYTFMGWYSDADCTESFDFTASLTEDTTAYAYWYEVPSGYYIATFYLNDGTEAFWMRVTFSSGSFYQTIVAQVSDPEWDGYHFTGWYADEDCTSTPKALASYSANTDFYAGWQHIYTMEAEHTYLTGKYGSGYSGSTTGTGMIMSDKSENQTASNGYCVGWLYYNGAYLTFEFEAEEAADDVTIIFRLTAEYNDCVAEDDDIYVGVNYDEDTEAYEQTYDFPLSITSTSEMSSYWYDFSDYVVAENVSIKEGSNTIELVINNNTSGVGGTMKAAAPVVDCMYLYTAADLELISYNTDQY